MISSTQGVVLGNWETESDTLPAAAAAATTGWVSTD